MDNGKYKVNMQYSNKLTRITFPVPVLEELVKRERVTQDRSNAVDAAVVRIMKSRKKLGVNQLKIEVITLMQTFKPDDALIKRRIENLIEREYLERDKADQSQLLYKAWPDKSDRFLLLTIVSFNLYSVQQYSFVYFKAVTIEIESL